MDIQFWKSELLKKFSNMISKKVKTVKGLVKQLRTIRDQMNAELENMSSEQRTEYFKKLREKSNSPQQTV